MARPTNYGSSASSVGRSTASALSATRMEATFGERSGVGAVRRHERCECGSGAKAKRCCGVQRGPSDAELARAFLASQVGPARVLRHCSDDELDELEAEMIEFPTIGTSLQLPLPRLLTPDVERGPGRGRHPAEVEHGQGHDGFGRAKPECDAGQQAQLGVHALHPGIGKTVARAASMAKRSVEASASATTRVTRLRRHARCSDPGRVRSKNARTLPGSSARHRRRPSPRS